ncbi:MAG TPA: Gfo/Idh/MocA family oxidoreductase [Terriglobales bacterium]|nr:Gfo/Idh/MocA family oxidoreductase [Terriglobales bacterium]
MTIHVGLIGGGNISETHARAARAIPGLAIAAIYGTNAAKVNRLAHQYGGRPYDDLTAFVNHRPMDFVAIGSPSGLHAAHGVAAVSRGLHVLTEKPIDISTERADVLIEAARAANLKLGVMFQDRFKPGIQRFKQYIEAGVIGKPLLVDARVKWYRSPEYYSDSKWRGTLTLDGGGAVINQAVHTIDLLLWVFGDVARVQAGTATALHAIEGEDTAIALLHFASGALGTLVATTAAFPGYPRRIEATGSEGTLVLEHDRVVAAGLRNPPAGLSVSLAAAENENVASPVVSDFTGHQAVFEDFVRAIREDGTPLCDGREGRRSLALVEEIYRAAERGSER